MDDFAITVKMKDELQSIEFEVFEKHFTEMQKIDNNKFGLYIDQFGANKGFIVKSIPWTMTNRIVGPYNDKFLDKLEEIINWFKSHQKFCCISIIPRVDHVKIINQLLAENFILDGYQSFWIKKVNEQSEIDLTFESIRDVSPDNEDDFIDVGLDAFQLKKNKTLMEVFSSLWKVSFQLEDSFNYVYYDGDKAVGTGSLFMSGEFGFLANGAVLQEARGRKIQQALIQHRITKAQSQRAKYVVATTDLDSTSGRNMQRNHFKLAFNVNNYIIRFN